MMKIYLPYPNVRKTLIILSEKDLNHQRNCALTILESIAGKAKGWKWHPGVNMWWGSENLLGHIAWMINEEWAQQVATSQGYSTTKAIEGLIKTYHGQLTDLGFDLKQIQSMPAILPWWWGHKRFHAGERSALLHLDKAWYSQFFKDQPSDLVEWWPRFDKDKFVFGPHVGPDGDFAAYHLEDKPILRSAESMTPRDFAHHANTFHNLLGSVKAPIKSNEPVMSSLILLHDRFHQKRLYSSHEHVGYHRQPQEQSTVAGQV